jgi:hypothetical protein
MKIKNPKKAQTFSAHAEILKQEANFEQNPSKTDQQSKIIYLYTIKKNK